MTGSKFGLSPCGFGFVAAVAPLLACDVFNIPSPSTFCGHSAFFLFFCSPSAVVTGVFISTASSASLDGSNAGHQARLSATPKLTAFARIFGQIEAHDCWILLSFVIQGHFATSRCRRRWTLAPDWLDHLNVHSFDIQPLELRYWPLL